MRSLTRVPLALAAFLLGLAFTPAKAEYLFTANGDFITPTLSESAKVRYSEWREYYSTSTQGNLPTWYAESGGTSPDGTHWFPTARPLDNPNFPDYYPTYYKLSQPNAFWDVRNPTITQTNVANGYITGGANHAGNFYGLDGPQSFRLDDNTAQTSDQSGPSGTGYTAGTVVFQFQTDGLVVDLSNIRLVYMSGGVETYIYANDVNLAEYLREYRPPAGGSENPSASQGYQNRTVVQWDLSGLGISQYWLEWDTAAHTSFQQAALSSSDTYTPGIPVSHTWTGSSGNWNNGAEWLQRAGGAGYGSTPVANGNVRFENSGQAEVLLESNQTIGELIFDSPNNVTIDTANGSKITSNTGISTTSSATGTYTVRSDYVLGALNIFDLNAGTVVMDGVISGDYGLVKTGAGALVLANSNTFNGFFDIQGGEVRLEAANFYAGETIVRGGRLVIAADGALGSSGTAIKVGFDETFFADATPAEIILDGSRTLNRAITAVANNSQIVLGARNTAGGQAVFSGSVTLTSGNAEVVFRAEGADDTLVLSGAITGGARSKNVVIDGEGTVVFSGSAKGYGSSTIVSNGTLVLESSYVGTGNWTVRNGAVLQVDAQIGASSSTSVTVENGGRLEGSGSILRSVVTGGLDSVIVADGGLSLASLNATQGVTFAYELPLDSPLQISGLLTGSGTEMIQFSFLDLSGIEAGTTYTLLTFGSSSGLDASDFAILTPGLVLDTSFGSGGWNLDGDSLEVRFSVIPEPSTFVLLALGLALAIRPLLRRRRSLS